MAIAKKHNEIVFFAVLKSAGIPLPTPEYKFLASRRFRFDYAWPDFMLALEIEGGVWTGGRHTSGAGFVRDMEKYNLAAMDGWTVVRTVPDKLLRTETINMIEICINNRRQKCR